MNLKGKIVEVLKKYQIEVETPSNVYDMLQSSDFDAAATEIAELVNGGWISVEDRLPEKEDNVLAVLGGEVCLMAYFEFTENGVSNKVWGYVYDGINGDAIFDDNYYPTHWQPLPSPPKR